MAWLRRLLMPVLGRPMRCLGRAGDRIGGCGWTGRLHRRWRALLPAHLLPHCPSCGALADDVRCRRCGWATFVVGHAPHCGRPLETNQIVYRSVS